MSKGDALVTVATGELSTSEAERTGLVPTHAYAVLDVRTVNGVSRLTGKLKEQTGVTHTCLSDNPNCSLGGSS